MYLYLSLQISASISKHLLLDCGPGPAILNCWIVARRACLVLARKTVEGMRCRFSAGYIYIHTERKKEREREGERGREGGRERARGFGCEHRHRF